MISGLRVEAFLLARAAHVDSLGLLHVIGGGLMTLTVAVLPTADQFAAVLRISDEAAETRPRALQLDITAPDGAELLHMAGVAAMEASASAGGRVAWTQTFSFLLPLTRAGSHTVTFRVDGDVVGQVDFDVRLGQ